MLDSPWHSAPPGSVLVIDGLFLHRGELVDGWDLSVFLDVPVEVAVARMAHRDGTDPDPTHPSTARYVQGQRLYFEACAPWRRVELMIDNEFPERPRLLPGAVVRCRQAPMRGPASSPELSSDEAIHAAAYPKPTAGETVLHS